MNPRYFLLPLLACIPCIAFSSESYESLHERFIEERRALAEEQKAIREGYRDADPETLRSALADWRTENRERFDAVREMADSLARESEMRLYDPEAIAERISRLEAIEIPDGLSAAEQGYFEERRRLQIDRLNKMRELADLSLSERREAMRQWRDDEADRISGLRNQAELASGARREEIPDLPDLPDDLSSEERTFIELRHELYRDRLRLEGEYADASQEELRAALDEWRYERREDFEYVRTLAEELSQ